MERVRAFASRSRHHDSAITFVISWIAALWAIGLAGQMEGATPATDSRFLRALVSTIGRRRDRCVETLPCRTLPWVVSEGRAPGACAGATRIPVSPAATSFALSYLPTAAAGVGVGGELHDEGTQALCVLMR